METKGKIQISDKTQSLVVRKIYPKENELSFDREMDGRIIVGRVSIINNCLVVEDEGKIEGVFSLDHYYFLKTRD